MKPFHAWLNANASICIEFQRYYVITESNFIIHQFCFTPGPLTKIGLDTSSVLLPSLITQLLVNLLSRHVKLQYQRYDLCSHS